MSVEKRTEYAVARGNEIITDWTADPFVAATTLQQGNQKMRDVRLEPDLHMVESTVEITTKRSRAKAYEPPQAEPAEATGTEPTIEPVDEPQLPASGIWGDDDGKIAEQLIHEQAAQALQDSIPQGAPAEGAPQDAAQGGSAAEGTSTEVVSADGTPTASSTKGADGGQAKS